MKPLKTHPLEPLIDQYLSQKNITASTLKTYKIAFKYYVKYLKEHRILYPSASDLLTFKRERIELGLSHTYLYIFLSAIKGLYHYLSRQDEQGLLGGHYEVDISKHMSNPSPIPVLKKRVLTLEEAKHLLLCTKENRHHIHHYRDHAIIALMLLSALSPYDIVHARRSNFFFHDGQRKLFINKKGERRYAHTIELSDIAFHALRDYVLKRDDQNPYLFVSHRQKGNEGHVSRTFFYERFPRILSSCGFSSRLVTPHSLRHSAALFYYESGATIEEVKALLRHKLLSTTKKYELYHQRLHHDAELKIEQLLHDDEEVTS